MEGARAGCQRFEELVSGTFEWNLFSSSFFSFFSFFSFPPLQFLSNFSLSFFFFSHRHTENGASKPILHRDLKPANILLDKNMNAKLCDFGLATELASTNKLAQTCGVGTPYYMSPELVNSQRYDERSDIWSVGCIIYECAALRPPFDAANQLALAVKINAGQYKRLPAQYSDELERTCGWMLRIDISRRPKVEDLERLPNLVLPLREARLGLKEIELANREAKAVREVKSGEDKLREREENVRRREAEVKKYEAGLEKRMREVVERENRVAAREGAAAAAGGEDQQRENGGGVGGRGGGAHHEHNTRKRNSSGFRIPHLAQEFGAAAAAVPSSVPSNVRASTKSSRVPAPPPPPPPPTHASRGNDENVAPMNWNAGDGKKGGGGGGGLGKGGGEKQKDFDAYAKRRRAAPGAAAHGLAYAGGR